MKNNIAHPALWTKDFILAFVSNILLLFSFFMLIPALPLYLTENFVTSDSPALIVSFALFPFCQSALMLYAIAFLPDMGFGYISPAFQTMFINLGGHNRRGTVNAACFTSWDLGIGVGTATGGTIIEPYGMCSLLIVAGLIYFAIVSGT